MDDGIEIQEVKQFLSCCVPFDQLSDELLAGAARAVHITYHPAGNQQGRHAALFDQDNPRLYIVRSGAVEIRSREGQLLDRVDAGGCFGFPSLLTGEAVTNRAIFIEDCLLYQLDETTFHALCSRDRHFDRFFNRAHARRLRRAVRLRERDTWLNERVAEVMSGQPVTIAPQTTVEEAARAMTAARVSSLIALDGERICGVITDRDLRSRVLAEGRDGGTRVADILSPEPVCVQADALVFEALMLMSGHNIHHLPVVRDAVLCGVVTTTDIMHNLHAEPVSLIGAISRQRDSKGLQSTAQRIPVLLRNMVARKARADEVGRVLTAITDTMTRQLIAQAIASLGEPPLPFVWLAFGSQGRQEQSAKSDQDNGLLLDDSYSPERHQDYFQALANYVCDGLNACGYRYCPGEVMASNGRWRQSLSDWQACFANWIVEPQPDALMHASIFFDMRAVYGADHLLKQLQNRVLQASKKNSIFLACLTENALKNTPPLGFFRQFVVERNGEHKNAFDMKLRGIMPITDIARIYALAAGVSEINTLKRLKAVANTEWLSLKDARSLCDAYEYISHLRLLHQGRQMQADEVIDNHLSPDAVSGLLKHQLRDAFDVVVRAQAALKLKFTGFFF